MDTDAEIVWCVLFFSFLCVCVSRWVSVRWMQTISLTCPCFPPHYIPSFRLLLQATYHHSTSGLARCLRSLVGLPSFSTRLHHKVRHGRASQLNL